MREFGLSDKLSGSWNLRKADSNVHSELLTIALFAISTKFKARVAHTAEGAQHVDAAMGTLGTARTALINVYMRKTTNKPQMGLITQTNGNSLCPCKNTRRKIKIRWAWGSCDGKLFISKIYLLYKAAQYYTHISRSYWDISELINLLLVLYDWK